MRSTTLPKLLVRAVLAPAFLVVACAATPPERAAATKGMVKRSDLEIVDCLLPGQGRQLGNSTYLTPRRPVRTTTSECSIRGGEYVAYDRADLASALRIWMETAQTGDAEAMTKVGESVIRYKTGLLGAERGRPSLGWVVGWAEKGKQHTVFAMNMDCRTKDHIAARITVTQQCLADIGAV